ncbi:hypothetical protein HA402_000086 [Bradysia odoriphaga]|nr:hypothetical protein HA402_000086 [Bradysia odoriphaga]
MDFYDFMMDGFTLETVKIANIQTELCTVKKENAVLKQNVAVLSTELCAVKKENTVLKENVVVLSTELCAVKKENAVMKEQSAVIKENLAVLTTELCTVKKDFQGKIETLSGANAALKKLYRTSLENVSKSDGEYKELKNYVETLRSDVDMLKSTSKASKVEHCKKIDSDVAVGEKLPAVDTKAGP